MGRDNERSRAAAKAAAENGEDHSGELITSHSSAASVFKQRKRGGGCPPHVIFNQLQRVLMGRGMRNHEAMELIGNELGEIEAWSPREIGEHFKVTFEERRHHAAYNIVCCDVPKEEVDRRTFEKRKADDRNRQRRNRAAAKVAKAAKSLPTRLRDVLDQVPDRGAVAISDIVDALCNLPKYRKSKATAVHRAVHRAVDRFVELGLVETAAIRGKRNFYARAVRRPLGADRTMS